ncbi:hypothetical protein [Selenomonas ruminantium]|uniref:hypothetical protein n=1 Tax=Selenomonas ruminantium TaxID=971 RepID=UPI0026E9761C|nr:hypothetical protein [Selenomonas ruminantium]
MKRIVIIALLSLAFFMEGFGDFRTAFAQDVWFASEYNQDYYLRTESLTRKGDTIDCNVIMVFKTGKSHTVHERFKYAVHMWNYYAGKNTLRPVTSNIYYETLFSTVEKYINVK